MNLRRIIVGGAIAVPLLIGAAVLTARMWLPALVRDRVVHTLERRIGLSARVGDVDVGVSSIRLSDVLVGDEQGVEPALLSAEHVTIQLGMWRLITDGMRAVTAVHVDALRVEVRRDHHEFEAWRTRMRSVQPQTNTAVSNTLALPELHVERALVLVSDDIGPLLSAQTEHVGMVRGVVTAQVTQMQVGEAPGSQLTLKDVELNAERDATGVVLRDMHVGNAAVVLPAQDAPSLRARLVRLLAQDDAPTPDAPEASEHTALFDRLLQRVAPGSLVAVERASVADAGVVVLRELKARMQMTSVDEMLLEGAGHTTSNGVIEWKLHVRPRELRGEGNVDLEDMPLALLTAFLPQLPWHDGAHSTVDAQLVLQSDGATRIGWSGRMALTDVALFSERIAPVPVVVRSVSLEGRGHFLPLDRRLEIEEGRVGLGAANVQVQGALEWAPDHYLVDLNATLPRSACEDVLGAIPRALLGDIATFHLVGSAAAKVRLKADSRALGDTEFSITVDDRCDFVEVPSVADLRRFTGAFTHYAVEPDETVFEMQTGPGTDAWTNIDDISPLFVHAVLAHEDTQFFSHHGFSPMHIRGALVRNLEAGRYVLGASTISMQLVKNLLLRREKTLARKAQEVVLTWWIERMLDKRDILELYLNVIEYGPSVYGIRNASRYYFSREPYELSPAESVFLSTILPNPKAYHSFFERNALSASWVERMRAQIQRMQSRGWYAPETAAFGLDELQAFKFHPEGSVRMPSATPMPTKTSLLPYQAGSLLSNGLPTMDQLNFATIDGGE